MDIQTPIQEFPTLRERNLAIRARYLETQNMAQVGREFGLSRESIRKIVLDLIAEMRGPARKAHDANDWLQVCFRAPAYLLDRFDQAAVTRFRSRQPALIEALELYLEKHDPQIDQDGRGNDGN